MVHSEVAAYDSGRPGPLLGRPAMLASHMSALSQSQLISQMGIRSGIAHSSPSPPGSKSATPSPSSSTQEEESEAHFKVGRVAMHSLGVPSRQQEDGPCMETGTTYQQKRRKSLTVPFAGKQGGRGFGEKMKSYS